MSDICNEIKNFKMDVPSGEFIDYFENGKIRSKHTYIDGKIEGESLFYNESGQIVIKSNFLNGERHGEQLCYYDNGVLSYKSFCVNGLKEGETVYYDENGNIIKTLIYEKEKLIQCTGKCD
jgi:antitoxin component YwqK of YwqJK toxin-antitoxin module